MNVVLIEPEIPPNTGNVARLCAATNSALHLIEPLGFKLTNTELQRAGLDYWKYVNLFTWKNWNAFESSLVLGANLWFVECKGPKKYSDVHFSPNDYLVFGRETAGIPAQLLEKYHNHWIRIPMFKQEVRSINLANCVAIVLFEALRQQNFTGEAPQTH
jgi:tRNA (cytidine/uridine-2'-O-)-methyltransferase